MRVAEFYLINEKGQEYSLMDEMNYCLLTEIDGLGCSFSSQYQQLGNTFVPILSKIDQGKINCTVRFINYDNFNNFSEFIENSEELKFLYKIPLKDNQKLEVLKDIKIQSIAKGRILEEGEKLISNITLDCLSLWYEVNTTVYSIGEQSNDEIRWDFRWDSKFSDHNAKNLPHINKGHTEAAVLIEVEGRVVNPAVLLYVEGKLFQTVTISTEIKEYEKLLYCTKENDFYINRLKTDGTLESLFNLDTIDFKNDNVVRIPRNKSCELRLIADTPIRKARITIFTYYKLM